MRLQTSGKPTLQNKTKANFYVIFTGSNNGAIVVYTTNGVTAYHTFKETTQPSSKGSSKGSSKAVQRVPEFGRCISCIRT